MYWSDEVEKDVSTGVKDWLREDRSDRVEEGMGTGVKD
jgi:hypothetical protein